MLTSKDLLIAAKNAQGLASNYRLARVLDAPEKTVSRWATEKCAPADAYALKLAALGGLDEAEVVASMRAQSAKDAKTKALWTDIAARLKATVGTTDWGSLGAVILSVSCFFGGGPDGGAHAATPGDHAISAPAKQRGSVYYVKSVSAYLTHNLAFLVAGCGGLSSIRWSDQSARAVGA